jgi:hypothetical protein
MVLQWSNLSGRNDVVSSKYKESHNVVVMAGPLSAVSALLRPCLGFVFSILFDDSETKF